VEGEVFVQSFTPFSPSIQFARHHDFDGFWEQEIEFRKKWGLSRRSRTSSSFRCVHRIKHERAFRPNAPSPARRIAPVRDHAQRACARAAGEVAWQLPLPPHAPNRRYLKLSRHLRAVLDKLPFPEDWIVTVDVDAYQLL
jgi:primosomal protein N' (replication factor Y)